MKFCGSSAWDWGSSIRFENCANREGSEGTNVF